MRRVAGHTATTVASPHSNWTKSAAETVSEIATDVLRAGQAALKDQCLKRDGHKCVLSGSPDVSVSDFGFPTECAHIKPFSLGEEKNLARCRLHNRINAVAYYFALAPGGISSDQWLFPEVGNFLPENLKEPPNAITMLPELHVEFSASLLCFEPTVR